MIGIGTWIGSLAGGGLLASLKAKLLFYGKYAQISGGQMPNILDSGTTYLTVAGSAGSETYQCPNTAAFIAADTDYIWFKTDASQRTVTTAELVGYDLQRTPVKYDDASPYQIREIAIFKTGETMTATERNNLFKVMWLPILWDNNLNGNGHIKANRLGQQLWTPESTYDATSDALFTRMTAVSETPDGTRKGIIDTAIIAAKAASLWTTLFDAMWLFAAHGNDSALLNILADEFNCTLVDTPTFTTDRGYTGNGSSDALNTNYNLATDSTLFTQNSCSMGVYIRTNNQSAQAFGVIKSSAPTYRTDLQPRHTDNNAYYGISSRGYDSNASNDSRGMWILTRSASNEFKVYKNGLEVVTESELTNALPSLIMHFLCYNGDGVLAGFSTHEISLGFIGAAMTPTDVANFQTIWVDGYLNSIGAKV
ncbi:MAG: hypothetical protein ABFC18_03470 [Rikenellaceae bacterium]